jgi:hypothetical protein
MILSFLLRHDEFDFITVNGRQIFQDEREKSKAGLAQALSVTVDGNRELIACVVVVMCSVLNAQRNGR